ncbi:hypothetical protein [Actinomadura sp. BRA 177]|uniref:hypothetical protein n=1 Tax=Actinomadura sp. BRA 177 TaxID=2745202 RepID=UPI001595B169|nr:hypothetical protein [Actinomadura sp. BRA 177]NVI88379.1 hypothetical protein [Actinomadura sp. BRA 177]
MPRTARDVVFVDGVRTPFGKAGPKGLYAETRADDLVVRAGLRVQAPLSLIPIRLCPRRGKS